MAKVTFFRTIWHVKASGELDYFRWAVWRYSVVLLCIFLVLQCSHHSLKLFVRFKHHIFPVKLQQCCVDWKNSPNLPSALRVSKNDWISIVGQTIPLNWAFNFGWTLTTCNTRVNISLRLPQKKMLSKLTQWCQLTTQYLKIMFAHTCHYKLAFCNCKLTACASRLM